MTSANPRVVRAVYRQLRRSSRYPATFPWSSTVFAGDVSEATSWLSFQRGDSPAACREELRSAFDRGSAPSSQTSTSAFDVLKHVNRRRWALYPEQQHVAGSLPCFVFQSQVLLPGESTEWIFFEPRFRRLAAHVLREEATSPTGRRFLHVPSSQKDAATGSDTVGVLCAVTDHQTLQDGREVVRATAGPRVRLKERRFENVDEVTGASRGFVSDNDDDEEEENEKAGGADLTAGPVAPPLLHSSFELFEDEPETFRESQHEVAALAAECRQLLGQVVQHIVGDPGELLALHEAEAEAQAEAQATATQTREQQQSANMARLGAMQRLGLVERIGFLPLEPDRLSFALLSLVLQPSDAARRSFWLSSENTASRLKFCEAAIKDQIPAAAAAAAADSSASEGSDGGRGSER